MTFEPATPTGKRFYHHLRAELFNECYCKWYEGRTGMYSVKSHEHGQQALWCLSSAVAKSNGRTWREMRRLLEELLDVVSGARRTDFVNELLDYLVEHPPAEADWDVRPNRVGLDFIG